MGLYWYDYLALGRLADVRTYPGLEAWTSIYKVFRQIMVDRTGNIRGPLRVTLDPGIGIPDPTRFPSESFEACCVQRARELLELAQRDKKMLVLMFSGGIDSTAIAVTFLKHFDYAHLRAKLVFATSTSAWIENPRFMHTHIAGKFELVSIRGLSAFSEGSAHIITGEMNDYYLPNSQYRRLGAGAEAQLSAAYSSDAVYEYLAPSIKKPHARMWAEILTADFSRAPIERRTFGEFLWWVRFNWTRQAYKFLPLIALGTFEHVKSLDECNARIHHFFESPSFEVWGMRNTDRSPRKRPLRELIATFVDDPYWLETKQKYNSIAEVVMSRAAPVGIDADFKPIYEQRELLAHFDPANDFREH